MTTPSPLLRFAWAFLAFVQLSVTVGAPLADALHEDVDERVTHVESESGEDCPTQHDHLFCQLCRTMVLAGAEVQPARVQGLHRTTGEGLVGSAAERLPTPSGLFAPLGSRAPPRG